MEALTEFQNRVQLEVERAGKLHPPLANIFEALGVILEELDEFKAEVRKKRADRDKTKLLGELIQVAAMVQRTCQDVDLMGAEDRLNKNSPFVGLSFIGRVTKYTEFMDEANPKITSAHMGYMLMLRYFELARQNDVMPCMTESDSFKSLAFCRLAGMYITAESTSLLYID